MNEEMIESLDKILQEYEDGDVGFYELGDWLSSNGDSIISLLSIK